MTTEQLEALCEAAKKRLAQGINRSVGQHMRALRKSWKQK